MLLQVLEGKCTRCHLASEQVKVARTPPAGLGPPPGLVLLNCCSSNWQARNGAADDVLMLAKCQSGLKFKSLSCSARVQRAIM